MKFDFKILLFSLLLYTPFASGQGFVAEINEEDFSALLGNPCTIKLADGNTLRGKFLNGTLINGYFTKIAFQLDNGEKRKLKPEEVLRLSIKASTLMKLAMLSEAGSSIKEYSKTDHQKVLKRDSVIFERALKAKEKNEYALMQLLNPGFDNRLKVFIDPQARKSTELGMSNITFTGGENRVYLLVKNDEKAFRIKKNTYPKNIQEIYSDCPMLLADLEGKEAEWKDVAAHVYVYDQVCD